MIFFLLVYFCIYGSVHFYAFLKLKKGLGPGFSGQLILAVVMILMVAAPIGVRMLEHYGQEVFARGLAYVGFIWMALLFVFISASFFFDIYRFLHFGARHLVGSPLSGAILSARHFCLLAIILSVTAVFYGYFEALNIRTEHLTVKTDKLPGKIQKVRVVQISDVHLGLIVGRWRLERILDRVTAARPDILVSTGDLVDGQMDHLETLAGMFRRIPTKYGKYAITGNHEFYAGLNRALAFTEKAGFTLLRGDGVILDNILNVAGVDDPARGPYRPEGITAEPENRMLEKLPRDKFTLLLKHQPIVDSASTGLFDLQLSGHTHKGQIFPFCLLTKLRYPMHADLSKIGHNALLYVSRGSGTWGPPIRFLSPPEVTVIDIVHAD